MLNRKIERGKNLRNRSIENMEIIRNLIQKEKKEEYRKIKQREK